MTAKQPDDLDFFAGGVPAGAIFQLSAREIKKLLDAKPKRAIGHTLEEMCFIGLVSHFEAFFRDCFASLINICPALLQRLQPRGYDTTIDAVAALEMRGRLLYQIGFLVSEKYDFGTAQKVNALYTALMGVTPFSKDETKTYDSILSDRNLLVHHGGLYTTSYFRQKIGVRTARSRTFLDSLVIDRLYVEQRWNFLYTVASKTVKACHHAISEQAASGAIVIDPTARGGLKMFNWWDE